METYIKKYGRNSLIISILLIVLSLFLIFKPGISINVLTITLGCILALNGVIHSVSYFSSSKEFKTFSFELVEGIVCIVLGIIFIFKPVLINSLLPVIIGTWIIFESVIKLQLAFNMKASFDNNWTIMLVLSLVTIVLGLIIVFNPFETIVAVTTLAGIILLVSEIINIVEYVKIVRLLK